MVHKSSEKVRLSAVYALVLVQVIKKNVAYSSSAKYHLKSANVATGNIGNTAIIKATVTQNTRKNKHDLKSVS